MFCGHGVCIGVQLMIRGEGPSIPFSLITQRWLNAPQHIVYDNACNFHRYCMNRRPRFFKNTVFWIDRFHGKNHVGCSSAYDLNNFPHDTADPAGMRSASSIPSTMPSTLPNTHQDASTIFLSKFVYCIHDCIHLCCQNSCIVFMIVFIYACVCRITSAAEVANKALRRLDGSINSMTLPHFMQTIRQHLFRYNVGVCKHLI